MHGAGQLPVLTPERNQPGCARWLLFVALALSSCTQPAGPPTRSARPVPPGQVTLQVLSLNDLHGQLEPIAMWTDEPTPRRVRVGGAAAMAATIAELRSGAADRTLLVDAGDFMHGTLLSNRFEGAPVSELYRLLGVAAAAIGNHEFDFGPVGPDSVATRAGQDPRGALRSWAASASLPLLAANIRRPAGTSPWRNVRSSVIVERAGIRVALVGLTSVQTPRTTMRDNVADLRFEPPLRHLRREVARLRPRSDAVIVLAHLDGQCETRERSAPRRARPTAVCRGELFELLEALRPGEIDAIVAGHSHSCIQRRFNNILVVESCSHGKAVGRMALTVVRGKGVTNARVLPARIVCHDVFADTGSCEELGTAPRGRIVSNPLLRRHAATVAAASAVVQRYRALLPLREQRPVARLPRLLHHAYGGRSEVGLLFAELVRRSVPGAAVGLMNAGGIRGDLPGGEVTYNDFYRVFPFDNQMASVLLSGQQLTALLRAFIERPRAGLLSAAGLRLTVRCGHPRRLEAVADQEGKPLSPAGTYLVVLSDFMLKSSTIASIVSDLPPANLKVFAGRTVREVVIERLRHDGPPAVEQKTLTLLGNCAKSGARRPRHVCR